LKIASTGRNLLPLRAAKMEYSLVYSLFSNSPLCE
jgi:hypothetical protein